LDEIKVTVKSGEESTFYLNVDNVINPTGAHYEEAAVSDGHKRSKIFKLPKNLYIEKYKILSEYLNSINYTENWEFKVNGEIFKGT